MKIRDLVLLLAGGGLVVFGMVAVIYWRMMRLRMIMLKLNFLNWS